ncbi:MAG: flagellar assembly protein FliW [Deltaproteobacteria bacterium]|nr:flagellar assembly protein FliW [Deltaproteobacteria bacterium]
MLSVHTSRFGTIDVDEDKMIRFPEGLLGFPHQKEFVLLDHKPGSPFRWLQAVDKPELAFIMTNPFLFKQDYLDGLSSEEEAHIVGGQGEEIAVFALVTIPSGQAEKATINLLGPLVIDLKSRNGRQVILANAGYTHRHPLFPQPHSNGR